MAKGGFLKRHGIVRNAIREDMLYFAIPALLVLTAGLAVSTSDLVRRQGRMYVHSVHCVGGLALLIIGLIIMIVSQATLWRNYSSTVVIREDHQLITHGIYRFTRNPIYLGGIMAVCIGIPLYTSSLYGFLAMLVLIPIILNRIRMEEKLLTEEFHEAFQKYKETTKKLIPFIY
jgi:protein-S-isoprenylcysteine O-methyltransferase Ste14